MWIPNDEREAWANLAEAYGLKGEAGIETIKQLHELWDRQTHHKFEDWLRDEANLAHL